MSKFIMTMSAERFLRFCEVEDLIPYLSGYQSQLEWGQSKSCHSSPSTGGSETVHTQEECCHRRSFLPSLNAQVKKFPKAQQAMALKSCCQSNPGPEENITIVSKFDKGWIGIGMAKKNNSGRMEESQRGYKYSIVWKRMSRSFEEAHTLSI